MDTLYTIPPEKSAVICLDQMGPVAAKSDPGQHLVRTEPAEAKEQKADAIPKAV